MFDTNVSLKIFEKLSKYKDLEIEVTKIWHLKTKTLPAVIAALGMVTKLPLIMFLTERQKITLMGTAHILRKVLSMQCMCIYIYTYKKIYNTYILYIHIYIIYIYNISTYIWYSSLKDSLKQL